MWPIEIVVEGRPSVSRHQRHLQYQFANSFYCRGRRQELRAAHLRGTRAERRYWFALPVVQQPVGLSMRDSFDNPIRR